MKKTATLILCIMLTLMLFTGCASAATAVVAATEAPAAETADQSTAAAPAETSAWEWERKVTLVCPWGVGGGADGTLRPLQPILQEILGVPVEIANVEGAGGANGLDYTYKQPADGYTYVLATQSIIMLDLQKILPFDFRAEMKPVAKLVHSINIIASSQKAMEGKYTNFTEFIEYAKAHPQEMTCGMLTATGADSVSLKQTLAGGLGCDITEVENYIKVVNYSSGAELSAAIAGGHINIEVTGASEIQGLIDSGDIVPLISMSEKRMSAYPNVECTADYNIDSYVGTWRGLFARTGTPQEALDAMTAAVEQAWNDPDYQEFLKNASYLDRAGFAAPAEFQTLIDNEYVTFDAYLRGIGVIK